MIGLHVLLFGFLLANVVFVKAARRPGKASLTIFPHVSDLVAKLLDDFDSVVAQYLDDSTIELTEEDRRNLGLSDHDWEQFRRRMGDDRTDS